MRPFHWFLRRYCILFVAFVLSLLAPVQGLARGAAVQVNPSPDHWSQRFGGISVDIGQDAAADPDGNVYLTGSFKDSADFGGGALTSAGEEDIFLAKFNALGHPLWSKRFGNTASDAGYSVAIDPAGNVYLTGCFTGNVDFGAGNLNSNNEGDIFLAKFDPDGKPLWSQRFGAGGDDNGTGLAIDPSGSIYLTGYLWYGADFGGGMLTNASDNTFVAKFDFNGNHLWSKIFIQTGAVYSKDIAIDPGGNVLLTGYYTGSVNFGGGVLDSVLSGPEIFLVKLNGNGTHVWSKRFGSTGDDQGTNLAVDSTHGSSSGTKRNAFGVFGRGGWAGGFWPALADLGGGLGTFVAPVYGIYALVIGYGIYDGAGRRVHLPADPVGAAADGPPGQRAA
jgi:uncharacterized protein (AIM24 family)